MFDYLIVGAGLFGAVFAYEAKKRGYSCLVIDKRDHIGGNCYTEDWDGIQVHKYGAHIFRTSNVEIWNFINQFAEFNNFVNSPVANYKGHIYNLPFNMNTFSQMWEIRTPDEARQIIAQQRQEIIGDPTNLEEKAISLVGRDIYEVLVKGYTEKQWGRSCADLPASIIRRLPVRFVYDNNYYNDRFQGIPVGGYTRIIETMLDGCEVRLNVDYLLDRDGLQRQAKKVLYTGPIDSFYNYRFGPLEYRSLRFEHEKLNTDNYQGIAVMNFTDYETPYTRIIEHKHFEFGTQDYTVITREYPLEWTKGIEPYYPINDSKNQSRYEQYKALAEKETHVFFGGRLGTYAYTDMQDTIAAALSMSQRIL